MKILAILRNDIKYLVKRWFVIEINVELFVVVPVAHDTKWMIHNVEIQLLDISVFLVI